MSDSYSVRPLLFGQIPIAVWSTIRSLSNYEPNIRLTNALIECCPLLHHHIRPQHASIKGITCRLSPPCGPSHHSVQGHVGYASSAWWGFASVQNRDKIEAL